MDQRRRQQQDFAKSQLLSSVQATTRLVHCADWERTSRLRAGQARHQRDSSQVASALQTEPPCTLQQQFAEQLKEEHEHVQKALSDSSAQRAETRRVLLQQAKDRAEERERERAQAAESREVQRYARDSAVLRELAAVQLQSAVSTEQQLQRAANKAALQQSRDADLRWQQAALADDAAKAAKQRAELAERQGRSLEHARNLEEQIEHRHEMRQQLQSAWAQEQADYRGRAAAELFAQQEETRRSQDAKRCTMLAARKADRDRQEAAAARAAAEQAADDEELKEALRNEEAQFAAEQASRAATREAEGAYRQQLEQAMQQEAVARARQEEVSGRQWAAQEAERAAAAAAAQRARWQQAQDVAASQLQQIVAHQATRKCDKEQQRAEAAAQGERDAALGTELMEATRKKKDMDRAHWTAVQAQIDLKQQCWRAETELHERGRLEAATAQKLHQAAAALPQIRNFGYRKPQQF